MKQNKILTNKKEINLQEIKDHINKNKQELRVRKYLFFTMVSPCPYKDIANKKEILVNLQLNIQENNKIVLYSQRNYK